MQLTKEQKSKTGAFYTPPFWANLAVEYMRHMLPLPLEEYMFYDPAGGEGALMEALPEECKKLATTLEYDDVHIMREKGINAYRFDFLNDEMWRVKDRLQEYIDQKRLVIFTNPPFVKLPAEPKTFAGQIYGTNDSVALFYYRLAFELDATFICSFNKLDILQSVKMEDFRENFACGRPLLKMFVTPSSSWGLSGKFPIGFMIWSCQMDRKQYASAISQKMERWQELYEADPERIPNPKDYNPRPSISWDRSFTSDDYGLASKEQRLIYDQEMQKIIEADKEWVLNFITP